MISIEGRPRKRQRLAEVTAETTDAPQHTGGSCSDSVGCSEPYGRRQTAPSDVNSNDADFNSDSSLQSDLGDTLLAANDSGIVLSSSPLPRTKKKRVEAALPSRTGDHPSQHRRSSSAKRSCIRGAPTSHKHSRTSSGDALTSQLDTTFAETRPSLQQTFLGVTNASTAITCTTCGMSYVRGRQEDAALHRKFCKQSDKALEWELDVFAPKPQVRGSNEPLVVDIDHLPLRHPRIARVDGLASGGKLEQRVRKLVCHVDELLGALPLPPEVLLRCIFFVLIADASISTKEASCTSAASVIAFAVVQRISQAFRVVAPSSATPQNRLLSHAECDGPALYCAVDPVPALVGVHRIWTSPRHRRKGVAGKLLEHLAGHSIYGMPALGSNNIAFSQPTSAGQMLFSAWAGTPHFLVFDAP